MKKLCVFLMITGLATLAWADADDLVSQGKDKLYNRDVIGAHDDFEAALALEANHPQANLWYGLTRLIVVFQADATIDLLNAFGITKNNGDPIDAAALNPNNPDIKLPPGLPDNSPDLDEAQAYLRDVILNEVDLSLSENFSKLDDTFLDTIDTPYGLREIDAGEILLAKSLLNTLSSLLHIFSAYDTDQADIDYLVGQLASGQTSINYWLGVYTDLLTPRDGTSSIAGTQFNLAKSAFDSMLNNILDAINFVENEIDNQSDDLIVLDMSDPEIAAGVAETRERLNIMLASLDGPEDVIIPADLYRGVYDKTVALDLSELFNENDPLNIRALLPGFNADNNVLRSSFPDPTLSGVFPDATQADANHFLGFGPKFEEVKITWSGDTPVVELNWEAETDPTFSYYRVYCSITPEDAGSWKIIGGDIANPSETNLIHSDVSEAVSQIYYYRLRTYYNSGAEETYAKEAKAVLSIYVDVNAEASSTVADGSRQNPHKDLSLVLNNYATPGTRVRIAQGVYSDPLWNFHIWKKNGIIVEGGYEAENWTRDIRRYETILEGGDEVYQAVLNVVNTDDVTIDGLVITGGKGNGIDAWSAPGTTIRNCTLAYNRYNGINAWNYEYPVRPIEISGCVIEHNRGGVNFSGGAGIIRNNLIRNNGGSAAIVCHGNNSSQGQIIIDNNTIINNTSGGIVCQQYSTNTIIRNNIIVNNTGDGYYHSGIWSDDYSSPDIYNNNVFGNTPGNYYKCSSGIGDISEDPLFVDGPLGSYYLDDDSPCVDSGSDLANNLGFDDSYTTRVDGKADANQVDMGYHYPALLNSLNMVTINEFLPDPTGSDAGGEWVELYNSGDSAIDIGGCWIDDITIGGGSPQQIPYGTMVSAHGFYSLTLPGSDYLNNDADTANLLWPGGSGVIDQKDYTATTEGASHYRYPDGGDWAADLDITPTRGAVNDGNLLPAPTADFTVDANEGLRPLRVKFKSLSTGEITDYSWDFGDGYTSVKKNPRHKYRKVGKYTVSLTVTGSGGSDTETKTDYITVKKNNRPNITFLENYFDYFIAWSGRDAEDTPGELTYTYKIDYGQWSAPEKLHYVKVSELIRNLNLAPGKHIFRVRAIDTHNVYSRAKCITFKVK